MSAPPPLGQAEANEIHRRLDGGPPSAGSEIWRGPSVPARKGRVRPHQPRRILLFLEEIPWIIILFVS